MMLRSATRPARVLCPNARARCSATALQANVGEDGERRREGMVPGVDEEPLQVVLLDHPGQGLCLAPIERARIAGAECPGQFGREARNRERPERGKREDDGGADTLE